MLAVSAEEFVELGAEGGGEHGFFDEGEGVCGRVSAPEE